MPNNHFSDKEEERIFKLLELGHNPARIARRIGRPTSSVHSMIYYRKQSRSKLAAMLSGNQVQHIFSMNAYKLHGWIQRGWLVPTRVGRRKLRSRPTLTGSQDYQFTWTNLTQFMECEDYWFAWSPDRITRPALRSWAYGIRAGKPVWLKLHEVAERFAVSGDTIRRWIHCHLFVSVVKYHGYWIRDNATLHNHVVRTKTGVYRYRSLGNDLNRK